MAHIMFKFVPTGQEFELTDRFLLPEILWIQQKLGLDLSEAGQATQTMIGMFMVVRRTDHQKYNAKYFETCSTEDFDVFEKDETEEVPEETADPTPESVPEYHPPVTG